MKKRFAALIFVLIILTGCSFGTSYLPSDSEQNKNLNKSISIIGYNFEFQNPLLMKNKINRDIFFLIYDSLYTLNENYEPFNNLVLGENMLDKGNAWEFTLRPKVYFHDNTELSASDVAATIEFIKNNQCYYSYNVRNIESVEVLSADKFRLNLSYPSVNIKAQLTFPIVSAKSLIDSFTINGTGQYKLDNYIQRKRMELSYFEQYHGNTNPEIKRITVQLVPDKETANYAYQSGMADVYEQSVISNNSSAVAKEGYSLTGYISSNYVFLGFNFNNPIFRQKEVRKAINYAVDRETIIDDILFEHGQAVCTPFNSRFYMYNKSVYTEYNMEKGAGILKENNWVTNVNTGSLEKEIDGTVCPLSFTVIVNEENSFRVQTARTICDSLKLLGIEAYVQPLPYEECAQRYNSGDFDAILTGMTMGLDYDMSELLRSGWNKFNYQSEMADLILSNIAASDYNSEDKKNYFFRLQEFFLEELPHISLYYTENSVLYTNKIKKGVNPASSNLYNKIEEWSYKE